MIDFAVKIDLRSTTGGTDATIYAATREIGLDDGGLVKFPATLVLEQQFVQEFGRTDDRLQIPQRLGVRLNNQNQTYSDFLPNGADPQFWDLSTITVYDISRAESGDTLASVPAEFIGFISPSTLIYPATQRIIEFDVLDVRIKNNRVIASTTFAENPNFTAGTNDDVQGVIAPVILGDWTDGTQALPAFLIGEDTGDAVYAVSNHIIGSLSNVTRNGTPISPLSTDLANGTFTLAGPIDVNDVVTAQCIGFPLFFPDPNPVQMIQNMLVLFGGLVAGDFFNPVTFPLVATDGSWEYAYQQLGGSVPDYKMRAYIDNSDLRALDVAARMAYESNFALTVNSTTGKYEIYWELPTAATNIVDISEKRIDINGGVNIESDPDQIYTNLARVTFAPDPSQNGETTRSYDSDTDLGPTHPVEVNRTAFGEDVEFVDSFKYVYDESGAQLAIVRRLIWRSALPQEATIIIDNNATQVVPWTLQLNDDIRSDLPELNDVVYRINMVSRDPITGQVTIRGRSLQGLPVAGRWTSDVPEYDSHWTDDFGVTPVGQSGNWI